MFWKKKPKDETLIEAHKLGRRTMIDPARIYFWALSHSVDLKANRKRLKEPGLLSECVFRNLSIDDAPQ